MNNAADHHFHGHPDKRFTLQGIRDELRTRSVKRQPIKPKGWKQKK
jgi:hypothetical protein